MAWLEAPEGVLALRREPGFVCAANLSGRPVQLPDYGQLICASGPVEDGELPPDTAGWWSTGQPGIIG